MGAAAMAEVTLRTTVGPHDHRVPVFLFLATIFAYNYHRLFRGRGVRIGSHTDRHVWIASHRRSLTALMLLAGAASAGFAFLLSPASLLLLVPFGSVAVFYSVVPFAGRGRGIRDLPYIKAFVVALTWSAATAALPLVESAGTGVPVGTLVAECAERFLFILALTIPFDIRDLPYDDPGKRTLPQVIGVRGAKALALGALLAFAGVALARPDRDLGEGMALAGSAAISAILVLGVTRHRGELYYTGWLEGMMLVQLVVVDLAV